MLLCSPALKSLKKSANKALSEASTYALWELEDKLGTSAKSGDKQKEKEDEPLESQTSQAPAKPKTSKPKARHVMISYQWSSQKQVFKIRDELVKSGYKVWMDVDKMSE